MDNYIDIKVKVWRQAGPKAEGHFETYELKNIFQGASFLEMIDILNEQLISEHKDPIAFDHDCREGICGMPCGGDQCRHLWRRTHPGFGLRP